MIHFVDVLLQNVEVLHRKDTDGSLLRDQYMAENVSWILQKEQQRGNDCIFISGHNEHVAKWGSYDSMGTLGESYSIMNRFLPPSYRMFQPPTTLYDSMIYVSNASPTKIIE